MVLSFLLLCAVIASLAVGVLLAYAICFSMFKLFHMHSKQVAAMHQAKPGAAVAMRTS